MTAVVSIFGQVGDVQRGQTGALQFVLITSTGTFEVRVSVEQAQLIDLESSVHLTGTLHVETGAAGQEISYIRLLALSNVTQQPTPADHFRLLLITATHRRVAPVAADGTHRGGL